MLGPLTVDQDLVPAFRAALSAVPDPLAAGAGEAGEIVFLGTVVFENDYMRFCDDFAASWFTYPRRARDRMRRRREALFPHLGQSLLHGGVSYQGFALNVFVVQASGVVACWESQAEPR